jgi:hypothetical protein
MLIWNPRSVVYVSTCARKYLCEDTIYWEQVPTDLIVCGGCDTGSRLMNW